MQLRQVVVLGLVGLSAAPAARADGELIASGAYYKERSTRVVQPMLDARLDIGTAGELRAHTLVDSITSASPAAGATGTAFNERRYQVGSAYLHRIGTIRFGGGFRFSNEPDYRSFFASARGIAELAQKNTTIAASIARGFDSLSNAGSQNELADPIEGQLDTTTASASVGQVLTQTLVASLTYDFTYLDGFQENAYRQVIAGGIAEAERVPDSRLRHAIYGSMRAYVPSTNTTIAGGYRLYLDDWGIIGHTPDIRVVQAIRPSLHASLRYRFHDQSGADFYKEIYDTGEPADEPYLTADNKLGALQTHTIGAKLTIGLRYLGISGTLASGRVVLLFDYYAQSSRFGDAIVSQMALALPLRY